MACMSAPLTLKLRGCGPPKWGKGKGEGKPERKGKGREKEGKRREGGGRKENIKFGSLLSED